MENNRSKTIKDYINANTGDAVKKEPLSFTGMAVDAGKSLLSGTQQAVSGAADAVGGLADLGLFGAMNIWHPLNLVQYGINSFGWNLKPDAKALYDKIQKYKELADNSPDIKTKAEMQANLQKAQDAFRDRYNIIDNPGIISKVIKKIPGYADPVEGVGSVVRRFGEMIPSVAVGGPVGLVPKALTAAGMAAGSLGAEKLFPESSLAQFVGTTAGGFAPGVIGSKIFSKVPVVENPAEAAKAILSKTSPEDALELQNALKNSKASHALQETFSQMKPMAHEQYGKALGEIAANSKFPTNLAEELSSTLNNVKALPGTEAHTSANSARVVLDALNDPTLSNADKFLGLDNFRRQIAGDPNLTSLTRAIDQSLESASPGYLKNKVDYSKSLAHNLPENTRDIYETALKRDPNTVSRAADEAILHTVSPTVGYASLSRKLYNVATQRPETIVDNLIDRGNIATRHPFAASGSLATLTEGAKDEAQRGALLEQNQNIAAEISKNPLENNLSEKATKALGADALIAAIRNKSNPIQQPQLNEQPLQQMQEPGLDADSFGAFMNAKGAQKNPQPQQMNQIQQPQQLTNQDLASAQDFNQFMEMKNKMNQKPASKVEKPLTPMSDEELRFYKKEINEGNPVGWQSRFSQNRKQN